MEELSAISTYSNFSRTRFQERKSTEIDVTKENSDIVSFPKPEFSAERAAAMKDGYLWARGNSARLLQNRIDKQSQLDHLYGVSDNDEEISEAHLGRELTPEEIHLHGMFDHLHDVGKWDKEAIREHAADTKKREEIIKQMSLNEHQASILNKGIDADTGDFHRSDIAHHLMSAYLFILYTNDPENPLSKLGDEDKSLMLDGLKEHQFGGYYENLAINLGGYSEDEIGAIRGRPKLQEALSNPDLGLAWRYLIGEGGLDAINNPTYQKILKDQGWREIFIASGREGDILNMTEVGRFDDEGNFRMGGFPKIALINVMAILSGRFVGTMDTLEEGLDTCRLSVRQVGQEVVSAPAVVMYKTRRYESDALADLLLSDKYEGMREKIKYTEDEAKRKEIFEEVSMEIVEAAIDVAKRRGSL